MNSAPIWHQVTAGRPVIEVLSPFGPGEANQRMKVHGLARTLSARFQFKRFDQAGPMPNGVLVNGIRLNSTENKALKEALAHLALATRQGRQNHKLLKYIRFL